MSFERFLMLNLLKLMTQNMNKKFKLFQKERLPCGERNIYIMGAKVFSYLKKRKEPASVSGKAYPKIYFPHYFPDIKIFDRKPDIYNAAGEKMDIIFLRDNNFAHNPYGCGLSTSAKFIFDRFNIGLDTHVYTDGSFFDLMGSPKRRFALFMEPEVIKPRHYAELLKSKEYGINEFEKILTFNEKILNSFPNAVFFPIAANLWHDGGGKEKTKNISMVSTAKSMCDLHKVRLSMAWECKKKGLADTFGVFDGGPKCATADYLDNYRYSIMVENEISKYYFSERLTSCFATKTVPVYMGCTDIGKWFNTDGIIQITPKDADNLEEVLKICSVQDYQARAAAIEDNYNRSMAYHNIWDKMYIDIIKK